MSSRSSVRAWDAVATAARGLTGNRMRAVLAALGIAIGVAAIVTIIGLSASSRSNLLAELDKIGSNVLTVAPGADLEGRPATLPTYATRAVRGIDGVEVAASVSRIEGVTVRRTPFVPKEDTLGITVLAADPRLPEALDLNVSSGRFLPRGDGTAPTVVLGQVASRRLGVGIGGQVYIANDWYSVIGVIDATALDPALGSSALVGSARARIMTGDERSPTKMYIRVGDDRIDAVRGLVGATASPGASGSVLVSRPTEAMAARVATKSAFDGLFVGLGAVALLIGGVGVANVMVISVLERRGEIGLRRALGAGRRHIASQFFLEALILSLLGGLAGCLLGIVGTCAVSAARGWSPVVPYDVVAACVGASILIGVVAGAYPAMRASRLAPTEALRYA